MWWVKACVLLTLISSALSASLSLCPQECTCRPLGHRQEAFCSSLEFLKKPFPPKLAVLIAKLTVQDKSVTSIDPRLKNLRNLKHLNLSSNRIKYFTASQVPKSVITLDLSNNAISYIPTDWNALPELKRINLSGNPLSCSCDALWSRDALLSSYRIVVDQSAVCDSPKIDRGKSWLKAQCTSDAEFLFGEMQGDQPNEGSGSGDDWAQPLVTESPTLVEESGPIEEQFIESNVSPVSNVPESTESPLVDMAETGSGSDDFIFENTSEITTEPHQESSTVSAVFYEDDLDEDEDIAEEPTTLIPDETHTDIDLQRGFPITGCLINCSTPAPIDTSNDTESSPSPGFVEGADILYGDIFGKFSSTKTSDVAPTPVVETEAVTSSKEERTEVVQRKPEVIEETVKSDFIPPVESTQPKESPKEETETISESDSPKEKENAVQAQESKQSSSTFIFLGVLLLVMVCLIIYAVVRRTAAKKKGRHRSDVAGLDEKPAEEMKLIKPATVENGKQNGKPETIPLINSQNGTKSHAEDEPDTERTSKKEPVTPPGTPADEEDVELRQKSSNALLTPETKRVTIRASEIPDSVPKTPILVTRHIDSDGKVVTTPNLSQRSGK